MSVGSDSKDTLNLQVVQLSPVLSDSANINKVSYRRVWSGNEAAGVGQASVDIFVV